MLRAPGCAEGGGWEVTGIGYDNAAARRGEQTSALVAAQTGGASTPLNHKSS